MVNKMEADFKIEDSRIAIIGLGLMGGSLALALKGKCAALYGIDSDPAALEIARAKRIVDLAVSHPARLLPHVDLVILATPVPSIMDFIQKLPSITQNPCIVLDLGSTKRDLTQAMSSLPDNFDPVGGHPICGKEKLGLENAEANLFQNAPFVISPLKRTTRRAKSAAQQIIAAVGANCIEMTAEDHDRILAATSHLPFLIASALAVSTPCDVSTLIGPGFRSTSRVAGTPSHMMMGILKSNRDNVLKAVQSFRQSLEEIESALQSENFVELEKVLNRSRASYHSLTKN
jgi:prephenate dehydrogenase